jgi:NAD+ kinase
MSMEMRNIIIATKQGLEGAEQLSRRIGAWLEERGVAFSVYENERRAEDIPGVAEADMVLVLGGDGTVLSVARRVLKHRIPLFGVNMGRVGFLSESTPEHWSESLERILGGDCFPEERLALEFEVFRQEERVAAGVVINDMVVNRGTLARLVNLGMVIDGDSTAALRADGVILSTPNGSTGYSISAGGPVLHTGLEVFSLTPICPFLHDFKPLVLPADSKVEIEVREAEAEVYLTQDGQIGYALRSGDLVRVGRHSPGPVFMRTDGMSDMQKLAQKGLVR